MRPAGPAGHQATGPEDWADGDPVEIASLLGWPGAMSGTVAGRGPRGVTVRGLLSDGAEVAVKIGPVIRGERARRRHRDDLARLETLEASPNILALMASGVGPDGHPWEVRPWIAGGSLAARLATGALPSAEVAEVAIGAGLGLADLHRQGLLHANLRPTNLLRTAEGVILLDGIALAGAAGDGDAGDDLTPDQLADAVAHRPPEVLEGRPWTVPGDIWALGSCLHTLVSGRAPWAWEAVEGPAAVVLAMATGRPVGVRPAGTPAWLGALIDRCLATESAARPQSGATVAAMARHRPDDRMETMAPVAEASEGRPLGSSYLLEDQLGSGSSGLVWRAHRRWDDKPVAVKILRPELAEDPDAVARFLRERTTLVGLDHPNLVPIMDLVAEGSTLAIVMELVTGRDLRQVLAGGRLDADVACRLLAETAAGVAAVHAAGIVHRDLKPENILVEGSTPHLRARVTDFGIARAVSGPSVTRTDQLIGTAEYLAPELVAGQPVTVASDVYSLGVLGYELLAGRRPFQAEHPAAMLHAHLQQDPAPLEGLPPGAWEVLARAMAKDPTVRPSAADLAAELTRWAPRLAGVTARIGTGPTPAPPVTGPAPAPPVAADPLPTDLGGRHHQEAAAWQPPAPAGPGVSESQPAPVSGPGTGPVEATSEWSTWRRRAVPTDAPARTASAASHTKQLVAAAVAVVVAGVGLGIFLAHRHQTTPLATVTADVTASVKVTGKGAVTITWTDVSSIKGFQLYVLVHNRAVDPQRLTAGTTSQSIDGVAAGHQCYVVGAVFEGKVLPAGLPQQPPYNQECQDIP